ncbi:MAG: type IV secretion system protein VirD4, partial [Alphaproteobacteria bacterium]
VIACGLGVFAVTTAPSRHIHGNGRWGGWFDLRRMGLAGARGLILGEAFGGFVRDGGASHVVVVAPTGAGKTSGVVIPNLLSWTGSAVTLDPKREAWTATAGWRGMHGAAYMWAPLDSEGRSCRFNPLDQISTHRARRAVDLMKLAASLIPEPANDTRWIAQSAQRLFRALALYVLDTPGAEATIGEVWRIANTPDDLQAWCHLQAITRTDLDPACAADLAAFAGAVDKERAYIVNELHNALQPWSAALVRAATAASDFRLADLRARRMAIYLALDPGDMGAYGKLLRMFFEMAADAVMRDSETHTQHRVLLLIDEFATFGRLPLIEGLMAAARGYGARIMIVCQALSQLDDLYGVAGRNALLANAMRHLFMASPDPATSAYVSGRIGDATVATQTRSRASASGFAAGRLSTTTAQTARRLLKPEEFERLGAGRAVLLAPGAPPFRIALTPWFAVRALHRRCVAPPEIAPLAPAPPPSPFRTGVQTTRRGPRTGRRRATTRAAQGEMFGARPGSTTARANAPGPGEPPEDDDVRLLRYIDEFGENEDGPAG